MQNAAVLPRPGRWLPASILGLIVALSACSDSGPQTAATVELSASSTSIYVGQSVQITPTVKDKSGKALTDRVITYVSLSPTVANVTSDGTVLGLAPGQAIITATVDGITARVTIVVSLVPVSRVLMSRDTATLQAITTLQLLATPQDSAGHALSDRTVTWTTSDPTVATVSSAGLVSGVAPGSATISATAEGKSGTTRITVTPAAVATVDVAPPVSSIPEGSTVQLTATAKDAGGHVLTGRTFTWTSSDVTKATVSSTGLVTAVAPGVANILVTTGNVFGGASVLVVPVIVGSVDITPASPSVLKGNTVQLSATVKDTAGKVITSKPVTWSSLDTTIATVSSTGLVTGVAYGNIGVVAASGGKADTVTVNVLGPPVDRISIAPNPAELGINRSGRFTVTLLDASGDPTSAPVTWQVSDSTVATVDSTGLFTGLDLGTVNVYARASGRLALATLTVSSSQVASLQVTAPGYALAEGDSTQLTVVPYDAGGHLLSDRFISFSSSDPSVITVTALPGLTQAWVKAVGTGTATITVTSEGKTGTATFVVN